VLNGLIGFQFLYASGRIKIGWNLYEIPIFIARALGKKIRWRDEIPKKKSFLFFCFWILIRFA